ncbi:MAG: patatin-like phospholipase family protein [Fuerstiella sp.]|nr:hypothetical protein [Fuerstiella sp.]
MKWSDILGDSGSNLPLLTRTVDLTWLEAVDEETTAEDKNVAWSIYIEMRTRITTQELHFLDGDEETALTSVFHLFQLCRDLLKQNGADCRHTATITESVLNRVVRPLTAKWHKKKLAGEFLRDDKCRQFRGELQHVQSRLQDFERLSYAIASDEQLTPPKPQTTVTASGTPTSNLGNTITFDSLLALTSPIKGADRAADVVTKEQQEIKDRRKAAGLPFTATNDVVGMAISGGGIRSATFALGVLQGLADRGILKHVDVVSTVSGGGYLGSFLSSFLNTDDAACGPQHDREPFRSDSRAIRFLRNHSRYILPSNFLLRLRTGGLVLYGIISNLIILSTFVFACVLLTNYCIPETLIKISGLIKAEASYSEFSEFWSLCLVTKVM